MCERTADRGAFLDAAPADSASHFYFGSPDRAAADRGQAFQPGAHLGQSTGHELGCLPLGRFTALVFDGTGYHQLLSHTSRQSVSLFHCGNRKPHQRAYEQPSAAMKFVKEQVNLNSFLLAALIGLLSWMGQNLYNEVKTTHDAVLKMVPREEFLVEITALKVRVTALEMEVKNGRNHTQ